MQDFKKKTTHYSLERYQSKRAHTTPLPGHSSGICRATCKRTHANNSQQLLANNVGFSRRQKFDRFQNLRNNSQKHATRCNRVCKRTQYVPSNNVVSCWLRITLTSNGKREFVSSVSPLTFRLVFISSTYKLVVSRNFLSIRIVLSCLYLLSFYFDKLST